MKIHVTDNAELRDYIRQGLKDNQGFCPCIMDSLGKEEYRCVCREMREDIQVGESCHCGLYIKDEM